jgi:hypothetical protein
MVAIALDGEGRLFATATRHALDELGLDIGARVFALIKTSALDERKIASIPRGYRDLVAAKPDMTATLDSYRDTLEHLGAALASQTQRPVQRS